MKITTGQLSEVDSSILATRMSPFHDRRLCLDHCDQALQALLFEEYQNVWVSKMVIQVTCLIQTTRNQNLPL
jgi:DNA-binding MltR family transcriptional regulator